MSLPKVAHIKKLDIEEFPKGTVSKAWLHIINNGIGEPVRIPILIARGKEDGPVFGLTAALHGNELNGIPVIQKLMEDIDVQQLKGTIVGVLVSNIPGFLLEQRKFNDGKDLNHLAPGKANGDQSKLYIHRFIERIVLQFDYLIDLHTASFGRVNTYYIRADMDDEIISKLARLHNPEIILHNPSNDATLRGQAEHNGIKTITLELKDPHLIQYDVVEDCLVGLRNTLYYLGMLEGSIVCPVENTILCERSYWLYTDEGGLLTVYVHLGQWVKKGEKIACVKTIFGEVTKEYFAPEDGIVIGKSVNPINQSGSRIIHLGINPREIPCILDEEA